MNNQELKKLQQKVTLLRSEGKYKETIEAGYELLELGEECKDYKSILTAHINHAASYYSIGAIEEAFHSLEAYEEICSNYGDDADRLNLYNFLFLLYEYNKDYRKAKETLSKTIELGKKLKIYNIVSNAYSNYSHVYLAEDKYLEALEMAKKGLAMAKLHKPESRILEIRVTLNLAQALLELENYEEAKKIIDELQNDPTLTSAVREKSQTFILLGNWYVKQGQYENAFDAYTQAKELVESYKDVYLLQTIQENRSKMCEYMNDIPLGFQVQKEYISLLEEINKRELSITALKLEIKHSLSVIRKKANTDYLTGLYNRDYLETTANEWLSRASETGEFISCIVFDIDSFKQINDQFGHLFGDEVIKRVSHTCSTIMAENELFGRYGGDEFVVIVRDSSVGQAQKRAEQLQDTVSNMNISNHDKTIHITLSIGVADNSGGKITSFLELFHAADKALYQAKNNGKNQVITID